MGPLGWKVKKRGHGKGRYSLFFVTETKSGPPSEGLGTSSKGYRMKPTKVMLWTSLSLALLLTACKSGNESAGDKYLKGGDPINAIVQYEKALAKGKVSKSFYKNYADANIQLLEYRGKEDASNPILDEISNVISKTLAEHPDAETEAKFAAVLQ